MLVFNFSHPSVCVVVFLGGFDLQFPGDIEHFLMYLLAICISSFVNYLFISFSHFPIELFFFVLLSCGSFKNIFGIIRMYAPHFVLVLGLPFYFLVGIFL